MSGFRLILSACSLASAVGCGGSVPVAPGSLHGAAPGTAVESPALPRTIEFVLGKPGALTLRILDLEGSEVRTITVSLSSGVHELSWDGRTNSGFSAGGGVYFYEIVTPEGERSIGRIVLVR